MKPADRIAEIIRDKGIDLSRDDLMDIRMTAIDLPIDRYLEVMGWADEAIGLIVADPLYEGDIEMSDLEDVE